MKRMPPPNWSSSGHFVVVALGNALGLWFRSPYFLPLSWLWCLFLSFTTHFSKKVKLCWLWLQSIITICPSVREWHRGGSIAIMIIVCILLCSCRMVWHDVSEQRHPFYFALSEGCASIEADIFLKNGTLFVSLSMPKLYILPSIQVTHTEAAIIPSRTLDSLYIEPLVQTAQHLNTTGLL